MKHLLVFVFSLLSIYGLSQSTMPSFKSGSKLKYSIVTEQGAVQLNVSIDSLTPTFVKFKWSSNDVGSGSWIIKQKSLETASSGRWAQLQPNTDEVLPDDQSVGIISKAQWNSIKKDKKVQLDMVTYTIKTSTQPAKINDKEVDAIYLESENGASKIWVLNNPSFPVLIKISGNTAGPDVELKTVE